MKKEILLNEVKDVVMGNTLVQSVFLGDKLIWTRKSDKFLEVEPSVIWLNDEYEIEVVEVMSNTTWNVN